MNTIKIFHIVKTFKRKNGTPVKIKGMVTLTEAPKGSNNFNMVTVLDFLEGDGWEEFANETFHGMENVTESYKNLLNGKNKNWKLISIEEVA